MSAAATTLVKLGSASLGSQFGPVAGTDLVFELVHVTLAETTDWIECGGSSPQTQIVHRPVGCVFASTDAVAAKAVGITDGAGVLAAISGTKVIFTCAGTIAAADFDVIIIGFVN